MELEKEIWRNISGYPGYQVSNIGRVKSLERKVKLKNGSIRTIRERILKPKKRSYGYLQACIYKYGIKKFILIHRLVAYAFVQNESLFYNEINHIDECKTNNCASNLEWCDHIYNINFGSHNERMAKSKSKPVICIETGKIYPSTIEIERQLGFSNANISRCCNKKYGYKTVGGYHFEWAD